MAMREMVTGGAACAVPGSSSSSNPLGALANALIGSSSKTQFNPFPRLGSWPSAVEFLKHRRVIVKERLNEIPTAIPTSSDSPLHSETNDRFATLPGSEFDQQQFQQPYAPGSEFLSGFHSASQNALEDAWTETQRPLIPPPPGLGHIHDGGVGTQLQPTLDAPPQRILSNFLHAFVDSSRGEIPFRPTTLPLLGLSSGDKQCIRDRSSIMARHFFADKSEDFINAQVNALLCSLEIDSDIQAKGPPPGRFRELEEYWNESQGALGPGPHAADGWIGEFGRHRAEHGNPDVWARSFVQQHGADGWASEFEQEQTQIAQMRGANISNLAAMEQTQMLAHTLAQNNDPKFQNSKFLQFVSKMSRGELIIDDNQVKPGASSSSGDWAGEYQQQYGGGLNWAGEFKEQYGGGLNWADQFVHDEGPHKWIDEFTTEAKQHESGDEPWVDEFSKLHVQDWSEEFEQQHGGAADEWATSYDEYLNEQVALKQESNKSYGVYVFSDVNPYVGHPNPLKEGQELFRKGLLSEAVLALEAEVLKNPDNAEGWRLLGIANAENDDDHQAIASMMRAQEVDPTNLEVLLALGVSHTNELEQAAALKYLYGWLRHHSKYGVLAPMEQSDSLYSADVVRLFNDAAQMSPEDADVHIVLGVLYNLSREFDKAIASFQRALELKPRDYSLWNKLGATQANSVQSADAILAYQRAVELKPNYVRAWANMGISYANQGMHAESLPYYVQALTMNPKAENAWNYLRISLSCASRNDMMEACDARNLDILQKEFAL